MFICVVIAFPEVAVLTWGLSPQTAFCGELGRAERAKRVGLNLGLDQVLNELD
jgi:hypothetical protein